MKHLINFLFSNGITITKTKSNKGFMIYTPSQVTDIAKLSSLAASVNWKVIESPRKFDAETGKPVEARIYVGPVKSSYDISDKQPALDYLESQG